MSKRAKIQTASRGMDSFKNKEPIQKGRRKSRAKTRMGTENDSTGETKTIICSELTRIDACQTEGEDGEIQLSMRRQPATSSKRTSARCRLTP